MGCTTTLAGGDLSIIVGLLIMALLMVASVGIVIWAAAGARRRRLVLSRDGSVAREGKSAVVTAIVVIAVMIFGDVLFARVALCTLEERGWLPASDSPRCRPCPPRLGR